MPAFCHFWRMTPAEFRALRVREYRAMVEYQTTTQKRERSDLDALYRQIGAL